jgi:DNA repair exonuclease SbcCD ATPase subunit
VFYDRESDAIEHRATLAGLQQQITAKSGETDPYAEQIAEMRSTALVEISYDKINELVQVREHEEFLLKLLTNKDSFIRKKIIDQNLNYLNTRLSYYLEKIGLPHQVAFKNDLSVEITELGRDLDFDNLSRGERNRLILSLSWAFRDVYESLYHRMNLLFVDELVDSGLDASGMESSLAILKKISRDARKSVWLVSHRDELVSRVGNILRVTKQNGFTTYSTEVEV